VLIGDVLCWMGRWATRRRPGEESSGAPRGRATQPVVDGELVHREQAHPEGVALDEARGGHLTSGTLRGA